MTKEDRELLITDICGRLRSWPRIVTNDGDDGYITGVDDTVDGVFEVHILEDGESYDEYLELPDFKLCLRPMDSMTDEEMDEYDHLVDAFLNWENAHKVTDWLNRKRFDYRGLIPKGLAVPETEGPHNEVYDNEAESKKTRDMLYDAAKKLQEIADNLKSAGREIKQMEKDEPAIDRLWRKYKDL